MAAPNSSPVWLFFTKDKEVAGLVHCTKCNRTFTKPSTSTLRYHAEAGHLLRVPKLPAKRKVQRSGRAEGTNSEEEDEPDASQNQQTSEQTPPTPTQSEDGVAPIFRPGVPRSVATSEPSPSSSRASTSAPSKPRQTRSFEGDMDRCLSNLTAFSRGGSRESVVTDTLLFMIAHDDMPLSAVERPGFRSFVKALQPLYQIPSEPTITKKLEAKYKLLKEVTGQRLAKAEGLSLTLDLWTHKSTMNGYLGVTAHFREGTEIVCIELGARPMLERKTSANIASAMREICDDWKIDYNRVRAVVSDGGANVKAAVRTEVGLDKHIECGGHKINNIGQSVLGVPPTKPPSEMTPQEVVEVPDNEEEAIDLLDDLEEPVNESETPTALRPVVMKVKKIVRYFRSSEVAKEELLNAQRLQGKSEAQLVRLIQEVRTRWNSTYHMLERFLSLQDEVRSVIFKLKYERNSTKEKVPEFLTVDELEILTEVKDLLQPLEEATRILSSDKVVTISHVIPLVMALKQDIGKVVVSTPVAFNTKAKLLAEIDKRFNGVELLRPFAAATILDPRYKQWAFESTQASSYVINYLSGQINAKVAANAAAFDQQFREQEEAAEAGSSGLWSTVAARIRQRSVGANDLQQAGGMPAQMKTYLSNHPLDPKKAANPLEVWQTMRTGLEYVYQLAMDFLPIVATSTSAERLFSHAGLIATQLRNRISPQHLNMLVFLRSVPFNIWKSVP